MSEYDRRKDIAAEGQRAALYHGSKSHIDYVHDMITKSPEQKTIDALVAALEKSRNQLDHLNRCHKHLLSTDELLPAIDAALALARGGQPIA